MIKIQPNLFQAILKEQRHIKNKKKRAEIAESLAYNKMLQKLENGDLSIIQWILSAHRPEIWGKYHN